ncbi:MAG: adenylate/guanylate cyclase domain-containing protein [Spirochaetaceae bacterium]|nr:MAG: adenylate/guanylate cyclase domain-containing protein [Spirochaetaceae bacterium]
MERKSIFTRTFAALGVRADDPEELRLKKNLLVASSVLIGFLALLWGILYVFLGRPLAGSIPISYTVLSSVSVTLFALTAKYRLFRLSQLLLTLILPFFLATVLGGFINSSAVLLWSLTCPIGAFLFAGSKESVLWFVAYMVLLVASGFIEPFVARTARLPEGIITGFFVMNLAAVSTVSFMLLQYFVRQKDRAFHLLHLEQEKSEALLYNVLPREIAPALKEGGERIADRFEEASILFADMSGFTRLSAQVPPVEIVRLLNEYFSYFDSLCERHGVEKIRTIGDNYMAACGIPIPKADHAERLARMALEMQEYVESRPLFEGVRIRFRIGINSGPVVAGVVGLQKFHYDVWGDAVNFASRMESQGVPGKIQISRKTYELIREMFRCRRRGTVTVKGKGVRETWFLEGQR